MWYIIIALFLFIGFMDYCIVRSGSGIDTDSQDFPLDEPLSCETTASPLRSPHADTPHQTDQS